MNDFYASSSQTVVQGIISLGQNQFLIWSLLIGLIFALSLIVWGIYKTMDMSGRIGGFYYAKVPYKGYNRWRSQSWNAEHTM